MEVRPALAEGEETQNAASRLRDYAVTFLISIPSERTVRIAVFFGSLYNLSRSLFDELFKEAAGYSVDDLVYLTRGVREATLVERRHDVMLQGCVMWAYPVFLISAFAAYYTGRILQVLKNKLEAKC